MMSNDKKTVLVTGSSGFIGSNIRQKLSEITKYKVITYSRESNAEDLRKHIIEADFIIHLAGENRPLRREDFEIGNTALTKKICGLMEECASNDARLRTLIFASSTHAAGNTEYGISKRNAEIEIEKIQNHRAIRSFIFRLPNVFGKWSRPNYNSVVSTFCYNLINGLSLRIDDSNKSLSLTHIDTVCDDFIAILDGHGHNHLDSGFCVPSIVYEITVGELAATLTQFRDSRDTLAVGRTGVGIDRALYSTFMSYFKPEQFSYPLIQRGDERGAFVEMLKTPASGQISYFTAKPGVTRGGHYHHTKTEKFLVVAGKALFKFRHLNSQSYFEKETNGDKPEVVETCPGWVHDITNVGRSTLIVMLWANEVFNAEEPDTVNAKLDFSE